MAAAVAWRQMRRQADIGLLAACLIVYLVWLFQFGIHGYIVGLEVLLGAVLLALCSRIPRADWRMAALGMACLVTLAQFHVPNWGHLAWRSHWQGVANPELLPPAATVVFLVGKPAGYVVAGLCCDLRVVALSGEFNLHAKAGTSLTRQVEALVGAAAAIRVAYAGVLPMSAVEVLASYGLAATERCRSITPANVSFELCDVTR